MWLKPSLLPPKNNSLEQKRNEMNHAPDCGLFIKSIPF